MHPCHASPLTPQGDELLEVAGHSVCASPPFKVASLLQGGSADGADLALKVGEYLSVDA